MAGKPINLQDIEKLELNKIDKSQIKNTLTETEIGNVLDATQGKVLDDKISVLSYSEVLRGTIDFNTIKKYGFYRLNAISSDSSNKPNDIKLDGAIMYVYQAGDLIAQTVIDYVGKQATRLIGFAWTTQATTTDTTALSDKINVLNQEHKMKTYRSYSDLGLIAKWDSIEACVTSMPNDSVCVLDVQTNFNNYSNFFPTNSGVVTITKQNANRCYLLLTSSVVDVATSKVWYSWYREIETVKYSWQTIATTTKTDVLFPYASGYSDYNSSYGTLLSKNTLNEVILNIYAKPTSGTFGASTVKIGTLPVGYRPKRNIEINARTSSGIGTLTLYTNGAVNVTIANGTSNYISGTFVYDAK